MKSYSVEAFIIRMRPLGEADRVLTLFTRERGKLHAVGKGARKTQSEFGARLEFFARSRLTLHAGRSLDVITSADLIDSGWERVVEPAAFGFASYVCEVVDALCELDMPVPDIYDMLVAVHDALASGPASPAMHPVVDAHLLTALGFAPELDACTRCGTPLGTRPFAGGKAALSPEAGGLVCRSCLDAGSLQDGNVRHDYGIVRLSAAEFALLKQARDVPIAEAARYPELAKIARTTRAFVQHHMGRAPRAAATYEGIAAIRRRPRAVGGVS